MTEASIPMGPAINKEFIRLEKHQGVVVATILGGTFKDEKRILETLKNLGDVIEGKPNVRLVIDMSAVEYLSSSGLGRLVALLKRVMAGGGNLYLASIRKEIRELFEVMRLTQIFRIFDSVEEAKAAF